MAVYLQPIDSVSTESLYQWQNDKDIKYPLMGFRFPIQKKSVEEWVDSLRKKNGHSRVVYGIFWDEKEVGMVSLHDIDYVSKKCSFGIYVGDKEENNKGIGKHATYLILDVAFHALGMNRVELEVLSNNESAVSLYKKVGFIEEGRKRKAFFADNIFIDVVVMSILSDEFVFLNELTNQRLVPNFR